MKDHAPRILGGDLKGRALAVPAGRGTRPLRALARRSLFDILGPSVRGARVVDLYAGAGTIGLEAVSRGAADTVLVECGRPAIRALERSIATFGVEDRARVARVDALSYVVNCPPAGADLVYLGPPYPLFRGADPDLLELLRVVGRSIAAEGTLVVETPLEVTRPAVPSLEHDDDRVYGDTRLSFYRSP